MQKQSSKWLEIASAWKGIDKNGGEYIRVKHSVPVTEGTDLFLKPNAYKKLGDKSPDYKYVVPAENYYKGEIHSSAVTQKAKQARDLEVDSDEIQF